MARSLVWSDLNAEQLEAIRNAPLRQAKKGLSAREIVSRLTGIADDSSRNSIQLDLYLHTLQFGRDLQLSPDKLSGLFSIIKEVHQCSVGDKLPIDRSFTLFKEYMLQHSVQRPPYSIGLFSMPEYKAIMEWGLDTYYRHYKLYQYAFTDRVVMNVMQVHPSDIVELIPSSFLQPLDIAITQEQRLAELGELDKQEQQKAAAAEAAAAEAREAERLARLREEYEAAIPDEVRDKVAEAVEREMALLRNAMEAQFDAQQQELLAKISSLDGNTGTA